ncbi:MULTISPECIES: hypothetical protein [Sinorhizobium]|uniref:Uncharacterized protein n=2 Tax=Sinorhizobium TaxID=28105 RepID=A0A859QNY1_9HYPH|nr:hypothetical protein [Sinorhizobium mexicanum]MBP1884802.1 hypothetical protein [Sinorhizobium mexicanum]QLL64460.1 hypothetical protein FKV68_23890 [Sinorhizobium mexicanum]
MYPSREFHSDFFRPREIELLQCIFNAALEANEIKCNSPEAEALAKRLFTLYQGGVRDAAELSDRLKAA